MSSFLGAWRLPKVPKPPKPNWRRIYHAVMILIWASFWIDNFLQNNLPMMVWDTLLICLHVWQDYVETERKRKDGD